MIEKPLPEPLYCCARPECCEEYTWPASDLWWSDTLQGWYCDYCWSEEPLAETETPGISLHDELKNRGLTR